jgi:hypothetical protein
MMKIALHLLAVLVVGAVCFAIVINAQPGWAWS